MQHRWVLKLAPDGRKEARFNISIISDQTLNCHTNIVLSVYTEWLSKELSKGIKITLLATSSAPE